MAASKGIGILLASVLLAAVILVTTCFSAMDFSEKTAALIPQETLQEKPFLCNLLREAATIASHKLSKAAILGLPLQTEVAEVDSAVFMYYAIKRASMHSNLLGQPALKGFKKTEVFLLDPIGFDENLTSAIRIEGLSRNASALLVQNHTVIFSNSSKGQTILPLNGSVNGSLYVISPFDILTERTARGSDWGSCERLYTLSITEGQWLFTSTSKAFFFDKATLPRCLELTVNTPEMSTNLLNITLNSSLLDFSQCRGDLGDLRFALEIEVYEVAVTLTNPFNYDISSEAVLINITDPQLVKLIPKDGRGVRVFSSPKSKPYAVANEIPVYVEEVTDKWAALRVKVFIPSHSSKTIYIYLGDFTRSTVSSICSVSKILLHENFTHLEGWTWSSSGKGWSHGSSSNYFYSPPASHYIKVSTKKLLRGWYGALSKNITLSTPCKVVIEARCFEWCSDGAYGNALQKQILVDDQVIWSDSYTGSEGWQYIRKEVPLSLGEHVISLRLFASKKVRASSYSPLFWDEILVYSYTPISIDVHVNSVRLIDEHMEWLPSYLDYWDPLSKNAVFLVKLPSSLSNLTLYLFYGNYTLSASNDVRNVAVKELYDFEHGFEGWSFSKNAWSLENSSPYSGSWCLRGKDHSSSKEFPLRRSIEFQGFLEINYHIKFGENTAAHVALALRTKNGLLFKVLRADKNGRWQSPLLGFKNGVPYQPNKWYHIKVVIFKHIVAIWVDGELLAEHPIPLICNSRTIGNIQSIVFLPSTKKDKGIMWLDKVSIKYLPRHIPAAKIVKVRLLCKPQVYPVEANSSTLVISSLPSTKIEVIDPYTKHVIASSIFENSPITLKRSQLGDSIIVKTTELLSSNFLYAYNPSERKLKAFPLLPQPPSFKKSSPSWRFSKGGQGCAAYGWYPPDTATVIFCQDPQGNKRTRCHLLLLNEYLEGCFNVTIFTFQLKHNVVKNAKLFLKIVAEKRNGKELTYHYRLAGGTPPRPYLDRRISAGEWHSVTVNLTRDSSELGIPALKKIKELDLVLTCDGCCCFAELRDFKIQSSFIAVEGVPASKLYIISNGTSPAKTLSTPKLLADNCSCCKCWTGVTKGSHELSAEFGKTTSEGRSLIRISHIAKRLVDLSGLLLVKVNCSFQRQKASEILSLQVRIGLKLTTNKVFWSNWQSLNEGIPTIVTADFRHLGYVYAKELLINFRATGYTTQDTPHVLSAKAAIHHLEVFNNKTTYPIKTKPLPKSLSVVDAISPGDTYLFKDGFLVLKDRNPLEKTITIKGLSDVLIAIGLRKGKAVVLAQGGPTIRLPVDGELDKLLLASPLTKPYYGVIKPSTVFANRTALLEKFIKASIPSNLTVGEEVNLTAKCTYRNQAFLLVYKVRFNDVALELTPQGLLKALIFNASIFLSPPPLRIPASSISVFLIEQGSLTSLPTRELSRGVFKVHLPHNCTHANFLFLFSDGVALPAEVCIP